ncbi:uncharacterized protein HD556DRAFT_861826 [Suillus plorans]|uniref:Uncharacterized protein n=1 Tax=Suillus plorans TaxID=116603 RepID=A0A9P7AFC3_9AGAM|nr:uncharacterized protein HD556DRAFT_861826 [Suillus plorans]KAG1788304.1 hypothetical protein HD556DRAFT_861826 [Suillus plorans]
MVHNCIDWSVIPLRFLTISYGNKKVATRWGPASKVREFKSLQSFAHRKFDIRDHPSSSLRFRTTCNLSTTRFQDDSTFEVDTEAWEEEGLVDLVCCLEVYLEEVMPGPQSGEEATQPVEEEHEDTRVHEQVRDPDEREGEEGEHSDIADTNDNVEEDEAQDEDEDEGEKEEQEQENKEADQEENEKTDEFEEKKAAVVSDPQHSVPNAENQLITARAQDTPHVPDTERPIRKEKEVPPAYRVRVSSVAGSSQEGPALFRAHKPLDQRVKQEPNSAGRLESQPQATQATQESPELIHTKLVVSIQHKPSAQHAQFSAKPQTRIGKVLAGACKSFRLDVNVAQLYLVVVTQNDEGLKEEDHFLCDRNETVETAIVGVEGRANFMIRMPEDPAM